MKKRILSLLLVLLMVVSLMPTAALATNDVVTYAVTGGYIYFDRTTGTIVGCDYTVTEAAIPNEIYGIKVSGIENYAFSGCTKLEIIILANSVESIAPLAFESCDSLTNIKVDAGNSVFSSMNGVLFNKNKTVLLAYPRGKADVSYSIPDGVKEVLLPAFLDCVNLKNIFIPSGLNTIGRYAFSGCDNLESIMLPNTVTSIGEGAFSLCSNIKTIAVENDNPAYCVVDNVLFNKDKSTLIFYPCGKNDSSYIVPHNVTSIDRWAFSMCKNITAVTLPYGLSSIGYDAFMGCENLRNIILPNSITSIEDEAFYGCKSLEMINLPNKIKEIEDETFYGCTSLKSVNIPESVKTMGSSAFALCDGITDVYYVGSTAQWNAINFGVYNEALIKANVHTGSHIHEYTYYIISNPTCIQTGYITYKCLTCNYQDSRAHGEALGHNYINGLCIRCGAKDPNAHTHKYVETVTKPTCTEKGYTTYTCSVCGDSYKGSYTDALGHSYVGGVCTRCNAKDPNYKPTGFTDIPSDAFYANAVKWAVENEITTGVGNNRFDPNGQCTRGQVVTFLWSAAGKPTVSANVSFSDVQPGAFYYEAVKWAVANGITTGVGGNRFAPNDTCTRGQVVTFLHRAANSPAASTISSFTDVPSTAFYYNAVNWAVANGITNGTGNGRFSPNDTCTRGQVVTFLYRAQ